VPTTGRSAIEDYSGLLHGIVDLLESARHASARAVNAVMTATYWEIGRRIVEREQGGARRAEYGEELLKRLAADLTARFGRGFSADNLERMRLFYLSYGPERISATASRKSSVPSSATPSRNSDLAGISQTPSAELPDDAGAIILQTPSEHPPALTIRQTPSGKSTLATLAARFLLPWSHYVRLLSVENKNARAFYEAEALRGGWTDRQLDRQIDSQFYERTALSRNKAAMLKKGQKRRPADAVTPEEEIKDPFVLEFLDLRDEYSESDLEDALIRRLELFLLELGGDFAFVGRQRRLRVDDEWYRIDLLFFRRRLRCLVIIDLKLGKFTHADAGQMHLYLNYAREHWLCPGENPPVGLILCARKGSAVARYALEGLPNKVLAAEYRTALPAERLLAAEIEETCAALERRNVVARAPRGRRRREGEAPAEPHRRPNAKPNRGSHG
jgi:predicted nuclease of restriction endonuclease-like (RecB) superfamily